MDDKQEPQPKSLPFNNLYLNSGLVHGYNSPWMYMLTILFFISGYFFFQSIVMFPLMQRLISNGYSPEAILHNASLLFNSEALKLDRNIVLLLELGMFVFGFFGLYAGLRYLHRKPLLSVLTGYERFRFSRFWFSFSIWGALLILLTVINLVVAPEELVLTFEPAGLFFSVLIMVTLMPVQTGFEELVFRGYLVQGLSQIFRNGLLPVLVTSALFAMAHMSNPEVDKFGWPIMFTYYCSFALFLGMLTLLDEGLELAFGIHFANNLVSSVLVSSKSSVIRTYSLFETDVQDPYTELLVWSAMALLTFLLLRWKYKWSDYSVLIK